MLNHFLRELDRYQTAFVCSDIAEDHLADSVKSDSVLSLEDKGATLESQRVEEKPVTYHADFEMPILSVQVSRTHGSLAARGSLKQLNMSH